MEKIELKKYTTFKIGGEAKAVYFPKSIEEFVDLMKSIKNPLIFGGGSNLLISTAGIEQEVIFTTSLCDIKINGTKIIAQCGVKGQTLAKEAQKASLTGFEFMIGIPGTIGGMIFMNAGAHNQQISNCFSSCKVFDLNKKEILTLSKEEMCFDYRCSVLKGGRFILLSAEFDLQKDEQEKIDNIVERNIEFRKKHQPSLSTPNAGSIFKNPMGDSAGRLLDQAGAKSLSVGGAKVYDGHANFIVNVDNATSTDVSQLMLNMYKMVKNKYNIELEPEVKYFGIKTKEEEKIWQELLNN